jgi:hypothetical protein
MLTSRKQYGLPTYLVISVMTNRLVYQCITMDKGAIILTEDVVGYREMQAKRITLAT